MASSSSSIKSSMSTTLSFAKEIVAIESQVDAAIRSATELPRDEKLKVIKTQINSMEDAMGRVMLFHEDYGTGVGGEDSDRNNAFLTSYYKALIWRLKSLAKENQPPKKRTPEATEKVKRIKKRTIKSPDKERCVDCGETCLSCILDALHGKCASCSKADYLDTTNSLLRYDATIRGILNHT